MLTACFPSSVPSKPSVCFCEGMLIKPLWCKLKPLGVSLFTLRTNRDHMAFHFKIISPISFVFSYCYHKETNVDQE